MDSMKTLLKWEADCLMYTNAVIDDIVSQMKANPKSVTTIEKPKDMYLLNVELPEDTFNNLVEAAVQSIGGGLSDISDLLSSNIGDDTYEEFISMWTALFGRVVDEQHPEKISVISVQSSDNGDDIDDIRRHLGITFRYNTPKV